MPRVSTRALTSAPSDGAAVLGPGSTFFSGFFHAGHDDWAACSPAFSCAYACHFGFTEDFLYCNISALAKEGGWLARHSTINEMGPPHHSDVWAWAQSSLRWWSLSRACFCRYLHICLQIEQTQSTPENAIQIEQTQRASEGEQCETADKG